MVGAGVSTYFVQLERVGYSGVGGAGLTCLRFR